MGLLKKSVSFVLAIFSCSRIVLGASVINAVKVEMPMDPRANSVSRIHHHRQCPSALAWWWFVLEHAQGVRHGALFKDPWYTVRRPLIVTSEVFKYWTVFFEPTPGFFIVNDFLAKYGNKYPHYSTPLAFISESPLLFV